LSTNRGELPERLVLATGNAGKLRELRELLTPWKVDVRPQSEFTNGQAAETGLTFVENALAKARFAAGASGLPAIADDSGLVVPALGGEPGVRSARYAGPASNDIANNRRLIDALRGIEDRRAYFYCALVYMSAEDDPAPLIATAAWHGEIVAEPRGRNGFGYDPHFLLPSLGVTSAELAPEEKDRLSHRGQAARALQRALAGALAR
jgi:XTP/dITP diphosphohydrolase